MAENLSKIDIYTDGAARGNPEGPGGYGYVLRFVDSKGQVHEKEGSKGFVKTTNNRMELLAAIAGLSELNRPCDVTLYSDSQYLIKAFNDHWIDSWIKKGWKRSKNEPVKNVDLWKKLLNEVSKHKMTYVWVKGHADNEFNERCDRLATSAADGNNLYDDVIEQ